MGHFECLALTPSAAPGAAGSGNFDINAMYVTGSITSVSVKGSTADLKGTASVTGLGAGSNVPFESTAVAGGPGTTLVLKISGLTFNEIVLLGYTTGKRADETSHRGRRRRKSPFEAGYHKVHSTVNFPCRV